MKRVWKGINRYYALKKAQDRTYRRLARLTEAVSASMLLLGIATGDVKMFLACAQFSVMLIFAFVFFSLILDSFEAWWDERRVNNFIRMYMEHIEKKVG